MGKARRRKREWSRRTEPVRSVKTTTEVFARTLELLQTAELALNTLTEQADPRHRRPFFLNIIVFGRSVTTVLQNLRDIETGFDEWYQPYVNQITSDPQTRYLYELQTRILKLGEMPTGVSMNISGSPFDLMKRFPKPPNAKGFFVGDGLGGTGWVVTLLDGQEEKYYLYVPAETPGLPLSVNLFFVDAPEEFRQVPAQDICVRYVNFLRGMVEDAGKHFGKNAPGSQGKELTPNTAVMTTKPTTPSALLLFSRSVFVLNILIGLVRVMQAFSYLWTVILAYAFLGLCGLEIWFEPSLRKVRWPLSAAIVIATCWFSITVPFAKDPLEVSAYVPPGGHADAESIGGIAWDSHFTDLRMAMSNSTSNDYQNLDVVVKPDKWTHKAAVLSGAGCNLSEVGGNVLTMSKMPLKTSTQDSFTGMRIGDSYETYDSAGNEFVVMASESGYRLRCATFPSKSTIKMVFALVAPQPSLTPHMTGPLGGFAMDVQTYSGVTAWVEMLNSKPSPGTITITGKYTSGIKPHSIEQAIKVINH